MDYPQEIQILEEGISFLRTMGYHSPVSAVKDAGLASEYLEITCLSESGSRSININYAKMSDQKEAYVGLFILHHEDTEVANKIFALSHWLKLNPDAGEIQTTGDDAQKLLINFCATARSILTDPLRPVIIGESWVDIPFDWNGYK